MRGFINYTAPNTINVSITVAWQIPWRITVFWDAVMCYKVIGIWSFQGTWSLHLEGSTVQRIMNNLELYTFEDEGAMFHWNVRNQWRNVTCQKNGILNHMTVNTSNSQTFYRLVRVCEGVSLRISVIGNAGICYSSTNAGAWSNEGKDLTSQVSCCKSPVEWIVNEDRCLGHHEEVQYCQIHHEDVWWGLKCLWSVQKTVFKKWYYQNMWGYINLRLYYIYYI